MGVIGDWRVPGYVETRELGGGSRGRTVLVRHHSSGKSYVIRYLTAADPAARQRFDAESALLQQVFSPYVARWYGHLDEGPVSAVLMEAVNGGSLKDVLAWHGKLSPEASLAVFKRSLLGLHAAHSRGIVHGGHRPANIVVRKDGLSKLTGFGTSALAGEHRRLAFYRAPEQWRDEPAVPETDIYAATCVFFECLTGKPPFAGTADAHLSEPLPLDRIPDELHELLVEGLAKSAADRPSSAAAFAAELEARAVLAYGLNWEQHGLTLLGGLSGSLGNFLPSHPPVGTTVPPAL